MRKGSLRTRLLAVTVALLALGLLGANVATYMLLRSSLLTRVDEQLLASRSMATRSLFDERGLLAPSWRGRRTAPAATYTVLLDESGRVVASRSFGFGSFGSPPDLPEALPGSVRYDGAESARLLTVGSEDGVTRYRLLASALPRRQGTVVLAYPLVEVDATLRRLVLVEAAVTALVIAAAAGIAHWLVGLGFRPLAQIERTATEIAAGNLSKRVEHDDAHTEIGRLGRALNGMLSRIEAAFAERQESERRLRRFVADASHELRTPLTSIRGYAELFRRGADARPEDLAKSMRRIEEESSRMGTLVEEMLLLARLDQGRPLERAPVDLSRVAADVVEDARAVQPERPVTIDADTPVVVDGDEARLRQVLANLMGNALTHTPADARVRVRVRADGDRAIVEVEDEGPGLRPDQAERIFDRFYRVDPARSRDGGNAGLGLSIVKAIVEAHGGDVRVETSPGAGARFVVTLAASPAAPPEGVS